jgi:hypothetical protein
VLEVAEDAAAVLVDAIEVLEDLERMDLPSAAEDVGKLMVDFAATVEAEGVLADDLAAATTPVAPVAATTPPIAPVDATTTSGATMMTPVVAAAIPAADEESDAAPVLIAAPGPATKKKTFFSFDGCICM